MLQRVATIAYATYREAVRATVLLGLAGVAFGLQIYALFVAAYTLDEAPRVVSDLGAMTISVFSIVVAVFIGANTLYRELEMKTILPLLARPIHRGEFLIGKYAGIMLVVLVFVMAEGGFVLITSASFNGRPPQICAAVFGVLVVALGLVLLLRPKSRTYAPIPWSAAMLVAGYLLASTGPGERSLIAASALLTVFEVAIIAAVSMLFSSFSTPFLSALLTVWLFFIGRSADSMARLPVKMFGQLFHDAGHALSTVIPNLNIYVPARPLLTGEAADANLVKYLAMAGLQTCGWMVGLLAVATYVFARRDFT